MKFQLLWVGGAISGVGSSMTYLAFPLLIIAATGSPGMAGIATSLRIGANVALSMPAGAWVDRLDRRRVLVWCEVVRILTMASLVAVLLVPGADLMIAHILVVATVNGVCDAFFGPAHATAIRGVVPSNQLPSAYAQEEARSYAAGLAGPPLGGALYGLGRVLPFAADLISYIISLICILLAKVPRRPADEPGEAAAAPRPRTRMRHDVAEAARWIWDRPGIRAALVLSTLLNLPMNAQLIPMITMLEDRGATPANIGLVLAAAGVGGLIGALLAERIGRLLPPGVLMVAVGTTCGLAWCAATLGWGVYWPAVTLFVGALAVPALNVVLRVVVARLVPDAMMGRVVAVLGMASMGLAPLSPLIGGVLAQVFGGTVALLVLGGFTVAVSVLFLASGALRGLRADPVESPAEVSEAPTP